MASRVVLYSALNSPESLPNLCFFLWSMSDWASSYAAQSNEYTRRLCTPRTLSQAEALLGSAGYQDS